MINRILKYTLDLAVGGLTLAIVSFIVAPAHAQPVEPDQRQETILILGDAKEEIRTVREEMKDLEIRLTKQITLLQRQINQLSRQLEAEKAASTE